MSDPDPILQRREHFRFAALYGRRTGWFFFAVAAVAFLIAAIAGFNDTLGWTVIVSLLVGSAFLLPAIIVGYAVRAADRADLGLPDGH